MTQNNNALDQEDKWFYLSFDGFNTTEFYDSNKIQQRSTRDQKTVG